MKIIRPRDDSDLLVNGLEPKNGDFASYVEQLTQLPANPPRSSAPAESTAFGNSAGNALEQTPGRMLSSENTQAIGQAAQGTADQRQPGQARSASPGATRQSEQPFDLERWILNTAGRIGALAKRLSAAMIVTGILVIAIGASGQGWLPIDPSLGFFIIVAGLFLRNLAARKK